MKIVLTLILFLFCLKLAAQEFKASGECQEDNNANCSWSSNINYAKRAVFLYTRNGTQTCTGVLLNQRSGEKQPIFMTDRHCLDGLDLNVAHDMFFNYQSPACNDNDVPSASNVNGSNREGQRYKHTSTFTLIDGVQLPDVALLKINTPIPPHFDVCYAGWSTYMGQEYTLPHYSPHHPREDIKKVALTHTTYTVTNYTCHVITKVVDVILNTLFGWIVGEEIRTEKVCSYTESPLYFIPQWSEGMVEPGSSGAPLLNRDGYVIGNIVGGLINGCTIPVVPETHYAGRLNSAYNISRSVRNTLNPNEDSDLLFLSVDGAHIDTYSSLPDLKGLYFPAKDYQSENRITLKANQTVSNGGDLIIKTQADFVFASDTEVILKPGFGTEGGSSFVAKINGTENSRVGSSERPVMTREDHLDAISKIETPDYREFDVSRYLPGFTGSVNAETYVRLYPNPVSKMVYTYMSFHESQKLVTLNVYNSWGQSIATIKREEFQSGILEFDLSPYPGGIYFVEINSPGKKLMQKIVKE